VRVRDEGQRRVGIEGTGIALVPTVLVAKNLRTQRRAGTSLLSNIKPEVAG